MSYKFAYPKNAPQQVRPKKSRRKIWLSLSIIFVLAVLALGTVFVRALFLDPAIEKSGSLIVEQGDSGAVVWQRAVDNGFTSSTLPWRLQARELLPGQSIKPGTYDLKAGQQVSSAIALMIEGQKPDEEKITYPEGFTLEQIAERTAATGLTTKNQFLAAAQPQNYSDQFPFLSEVPAGRDLEGYLFPDTYSFFLDDSTEQIIQRMVATFARKLTPELRAGIDGQDRTLDEIVIMASIVEREVQTDEDMAKVAHVLWKRLDEGIGLGADATVRYALKKWDDPLTVDDLDIDSAYNTRKFRDLPPGPIASPGIRALRATIFPEPNEAYYYLSAPSGETIFSKDLQEHNQNKAKYLR